MTLSYSRSPFLGIASLFVLRLTLAYFLGIKSTWLIIILVLVYVGGVIVMFTYMTSVITKTKIITMGPRWVTFRVILGVCSLSAYSLATPSRELWACGGYTLDSVPLLFFLVNYILLALVRVFNLLNKKAGPIKIK